MPFDIQVKLHHNPGRLHQVDVQAFNDAYGVKLLISTDPGFTCPTGDCTLTYHLDAPTTGLGVDGLTEFRPDHPDRGSTKSGVMAIAFTVDNLRAEGFDDFRSPLISPLLLGAGPMHAIPHPRVSRVPAGLRGTSQVRSQRSRAAKRLVVRLAAA